MADELMEGPEGAGRGGRGILPIIIIIIVLVVVLVGGALAMRTFAPGTIPGLGEKPAAESEESDSAEKKGQKPQMGVLQDLKPFIVNLADPGGKRYLKLTLSLEVDNTEVQNEVASRLPQIRDAILLLLSGLTFDDISTRAGKMRLRNQIISICNDLLASGQVKGVYFSEFVVQ